jgi:D-xylose 1-dehydrogenase (NADP+, D-xylono-1,5-lactone-forming)
MTDVLRWGLLSTARINTALLPALRQSPRARLVAVASRDADRAAAYAAEHGIPTSFGSYEAMLADPGIDAVYNPLPNHLHAEWTIKAAQAGKHVLCEKPLACSLDEVEAITRAAAANGVVVAEAFMYRHHPQTLAVLDRIATGAIGEVLLVRGSFSFTLAGQGDIRLDPTMGGGSAWDVGVYPISYARTIVGAPPVEVQAWQHTGPTGVDLSCWGAIRFSNGAVAQFDCSFEAPYRTNLEIVGREGVIVVPDPFKVPAAGRYLVGPAFDALEPVDVPATEHLYTYEVEDLFEAAALGTSPRVTLADSRENVATVLAALASAQAGGQPVPLA